MTGGQRDANGCDGPICTTARERAARKQQCARRRSFCKWSGNSLLARPLLVGAPFHRMSTMASNVQKGRCVLVMTELSRRPVEASVRLLKIVDAARSVKAVRMRLAVDCHFDTPAPLFEGVARCSLVSESKVEEYLASDERGVSR